MTSTLETDDSGTRKWSSLQKVSKVVSSPDTTGLGSYNGDPLEQYLVRVQTLSTSNTCSTILRLMTSF